MKAVIIEDKDAKALVDKLELVKLRKRVQDSEADVVNDDFGKLHRIFHYEVVSWLQAQGCDLS